MHDGGLIVKGVDAYSRRERRQQIADLLVDFVRYIHRIALWLPVHIEQHRRFTIRGDNRINRRFGGRDRGDVADTDWYSRSGSLYYDPANFFRAMHLSADEPED